MAEARAVKFYAQVGYIKFYQMNKKVTPKRDVLWSCDLFKFLVSPYDISGTAKAIETSNFVCHVTVLIVGIMSCPLNGRGHSQVTSLFFSQISDNISKTVQDRD